MNVFFIASPQEALALKSIRQEIKIDICFAVSYRGYTDSAYFDLIKSILCLLGVEFECLVLYNHRICINENKFAKALLSSVQNKITLLRLKKLLQSTVKHDEHMCYYCQEKSPVLDILGKSKLYSIYNIDHSPSDGLHRQLKDNMGVNTSLYLSIQRLIENAGLFYRRGFNEVSSALGRQVFIWLVRLVVPSYCRDNLASAGYSWRLEAGQKLLSYRDIQLDIDIETSNIPYELKDTTVLLIDHPAQYKNVDYIKRDLEGMDLPVVYASMCRDHCLPQDIIIIKMHPYILQNAPKKEIREYVVSIKAELTKNNFCNVFELGEIVKETVHELLPIEALKEKLKIARFIGFYSSTMLLATCWDDVEVISDCRRSSAFRRLRHIERSHLQFRFFEF